MGYRSSLLKIEMSRTCQALKVSKWRLKFQPERKQNNVIFKRKFSLDFQWILGDVESSVAANFCISPPSFRCPSRLFCSGTTIKVGHSCFVDPPCIWHQKGSVETTLENPKEKSLLKAQRFPASLGCVLQEQVGWGPWLADPRVERVCHDNYPTTSLRKANSKLWQIIPSYCQCQTASCLWAISSAFPKKQFQHQ